MLQEAGCLADSGNRDMFENEVSITATYKADPATRQGLSQTSLPLIKVLLAVFQSTLGISLSSR